MKFVAIILARGGSQGIPGKNLVHVGGLPLIGHALIQALASRRLGGSVYVSTDSPAIGDYSRSLGAHVIDRPAEFATHEASSESALIHAIGQLSPRPDGVIFLQCTAPLLLAEDIDGVIAQIEDHSADSAFAGAPFSHFLWKNPAAAQGVNHEGGPRKRRQDLDPQYLEAGSVYGFKTEGFLKAQNRFFGKIGIHPIPFSRCFEIDDPEDLVVAEAKLRFLQQSTQADLLPKKIDAVVFDFDGVMTDNRVWVAQTGQETVACSRGDGTGIWALKNAGVPVLVISKEKNPVVQARCEKLQIPYFQGIDDKLPVLNQWLTEKGFQAKNTVYVGNDINDLDCLKNVGCGVVVGDAHPSVRPAARLILTQMGGLGAVRELCDLILKREGK